MGHSLSMQSCCMSYACFDNLYITSHNVFNCAHISYSKSLLYVEA